MTRLNKAQVAWDGFFESLRDCVATWRPALCRKEIEYSRVLADYLRECLPSDAHVECEYRHLGETVDVYVRYSGMLVGNEAFIELKRRLVRKAELNRLVGQVSALDPKRNNVLVVLIGEADVELVGRLRQQFKQFACGTGGTVLDQGTFSAVEIPEVDA